MFATATNYIFRKIKTEVCIYPTIYLLRLEASYFSFSLLVVSMINKNCDFKMWISDLPEFVFEHPDLIFVIGIGQLRGFKHLCLLCWASRTAWAFSIPILLSCSRRLFFESWMPRINLLCSCSSAPHFLSTSDRRSNSWIIDSRSRRKGSRSFLLHRLQLLVHWTPFFSQPTNWYSTIKRP